MNTQKAGCKRAFALLEAIVGLLLLNLTLLVFLSQQCRLAGIIQRLIVVDQGLAQTSTRQAKEQLWHENRHDQVS